MLYSIQLFCLEIKNNNFMIFKSQVDSLNVLNRQRILNKFNIYIIREKEFLFFLIINILTESKII